MPEHPAYILNEAFGVDEFEVLWQKGLKHIATMLATAYDLKFSKRSGMKEVYERLRHRGKAWVRNTHPWGPCNYVARRVFWSCKILDLKEVRDEVEVLTSGPLLSREDPEDRKLVERATKRPSEQAIDENIGILNMETRHTGAFLTRAMEFHHKYPDMKFWFFVEFD